MANINEMTMTEIVERAVALGFPKRKAKGEAFYHWNSSREMQAYEFLLKHDPDLNDDTDDDWPDDAA
ncbi:MAG: hypothetical protein L6W00_14630 [Lentisphaeria bacterium]|jgi:uncharacterized UBP type Zn finger protein|uniref:hypothetical protein n=1 Tax=uncultured Victivallis sp. TaxID=354118 RepID=UPI002597CF13|nr:hypothetical protein [uncultured Victivallis sp.]UKI34494.1 MAG: hypothetical protein L6W00_14630 [Lentisphaeria bacterium]